MANKILIVEDEVTLREFYQELLVSDGYEVDYASDGDSAYEKIIVGEWDLLLLDIMLPRLDGLEILKKIKRDAKLSTKPVIIISNLDGGAAIQEAKALGAREYLVKSNINPQNLIDSVRKYVSV